MDFLEWILPVGEATTRKINFPANMLTQVQLNDPKNDGFERVVGSQLKKGALIVFDSVNISKNDLESCCLVTDVEEYYDDIGYGEFLKVRVTYIDLLDSKK